MIVIRVSYLALAAVLCLMLAIFPGVAAQAPSSLAVVGEHQLDQDRRLVVLESINSERRLTAIETEAAEVRWEIRSMLGGVAGLLIEAVFRVGRKKAVKE